MAKKPAVVLPKILSVALVLALLQNLVLVLARPLPLVSGRWAGSGTDTCLMLQLRWPLSEPVF